MRDFITFDFAKTTRIKETHPKTGWAKLLKTMAISNCFYQLPITNYRLPILPFNYHPQPITKII